MGKSTSAGIPFILQTRSRAIEGIPPARVDKLSVVMTHARGIFAAMAVAGFICTFMIFMMWLTGSHVDDRKSIIAICVGECFAMGTAAGLCTYLFPFRMTKWEKDIRRLCGTILGISADPARVRLDSAKLMDQRLNASAAADKLPKLVHELARHPSTNRPRRASIATRESHRRFTQKNRDSRKHVNIARKEPGSARIPVPPKLRHCGPSLSKRREGTKVQVTVPVPSQTKGSWVSTAPIKFPFSSRLFCPSRSSSPGRSQIRCNYRFRRSADCHFDQESAEIARRTRANWLKKSMR